MATEQRLDAAIEAILFIADKPVSTVALASAVQQPVEAVTVGLEALRSRLEETGSGVELREIGGGWRLYACSTFDSVIASYLGDEVAPKLSQAALETLAVIAYKQPISRGQVASVRAVNVDSVVRTLVGRGLVQEAGTDPETGAVLFATTPLFLSALGISALDELPKIAPLLPDEETVTDE